MVVSALSSCNYQRRIKPSNQVSVKIPVTPGAVYDKQRFGSDNCYIKDLLEGEKEGHMSPPAYGAFLEDHVFQTLIEKNVVMGCGCLI
ncbi:hypothetical protein HanLR1_Chr02g0047251 [Helianthus annuus]|nr:hypothetical protein HanLR1_Chr02g0047251 [Helianthus annuus]